MPLDTVISVAAVIGAVGVIIGALVAIYKVAKRLDQAIGVDSKGRTLSERLDRVEHQLWENGGSSLADRVNKIEDLSNQVHTELILVKDILIALVGNQTQVTAAKITTTKTSRKKAS